MTNVQNRTVRMMLRLWSAPWRNSFVEVKREISYQETRLRFGAFVCAVSLFSLEQTALSQQLSIINTTRFTGECRFSLGKMFPCDVSVIHAEMSDGNSLVLFSAGKSRYTLSGRTGKSSPQNYILTITSFLMQESGNSIAQSDEVKGICTFSRDKTGETFHSIRCEVRQQQTAASYSFQLDNISDVEAR